MLDIRCVGVCGCQSDNRFVSFSTKPTQRACAQDRKWTRKGRSQKRQKKTVCRRDQSIEQAVTWWKQGREERRAEVRKTTAKTCWPTETVWTNAKRQVSIVSGFVRVFIRVKACISSQNSQKVSQTSLFLALGAGPSPCFSVCSFLPHSRLCFTYL